MPNIIELDSERMAETNLGQEHGQGAKQWLWFGREDKGAVKHNQASPCRQKHLPQVG